ncbi:MAG: hypothetical protein FJY73_07675 [Candidatus Eisenbacteria bacterium]|nr:hypothetical protein [Candidatus Eisenbacteria bacterium]
MSPTKTKIPKTKTRRSPAARGKREVREERPVLGGSGLCATCASAATCTFPRSPGLPVRFCEEFDGYGESLPAAEKSRVAPSLASIEAPESAWPVGEMKGLCRTCVRLEGCTYPKSAEGVWFCEEFR